jgi:phosphoglycolate phosphatase
MEDGLNRERLEALLFDFDGTLAPNLDLPDMRRQVVELTQDYGVPLHVYEGHYIVEVVDQAASHLRGSDVHAAQAYHAAAHQLILDLELRAAASTDPFPGVPDLLRSLREHGLKTGVVTRNCRQAILQVFPELLEHVDAVHARGDTQYLKPDARHITESLAALDVTPAAAAIVGDGALDMHVGRSLGMACIGVLTGSSDRKALLEAGADVVLASCLELPELDL